MKIIAFGFLGFCSWFLVPIDVFAWTEVNETISSMTVGGVTVTTGTVVRVDNQYGGGANLLPGRVGIKIQRLGTEGGNITCAGASSVSSVTTSGYIGWLVRGSTGTLELGMLRDAQLHCIADDSVGAGGARIAVMQIGRGVP